MQFINSIKAKIAGVYLVYLSHHMHDKQGSFKNFFNNSKSLLIILPTAKNTVKDAAAIIGRLSEEKTDITVLADERSVKELGTIKNVSVIPFTEKDKNFLGLPGKIYKDKINRKKYDLVVDLNLVPDYYSLDCIKSAKSNWRVGFYEGKEAKFFNILIKNSYQEAKISYKNLLNCLTMF